MPSDSNVHGAWSVPFESWRARPAVTLAAVGLIAVAIGHSTALADPPARTRRPSTTAASSAPTVSLDLGGSHLVADGAQGQTFNAPTLHARHGNAQLDIRVWWAAYDGTIRIAIEHPTGPVSSGFPRACAATLVLGRAITPDEEMVLDDALLVEGPVRLLGALTARGARIAICGDDFTLSTEDRAALARFAAFVQRVWPIPFDATPNLPACERGDTNACLALATEPFGQTRAARDAAATRACEVGASALGCYLQGDGRSPANPRALFERSCDLGYAYGCVRFGAYLLDDTTEEARARGRALYERACAAGDPRACFDLGHLLVLGYGGAADVPRGTELLNASCAAGELFACQVRASSIACAGGEVAACTAGARIAGNISAESVGFADIEARLSWRACQLGDSASCPGAVREQTAIAAPPRAPPTSARVPSPDTDPSDYIDEHRLILATSDGRRARHSLEVIFGQRQRELDDGQEALRRLRARIDELPAGDEKDRLAAQYRTDLAAIQRRFQQSQSELANTEAAWTRAIATRVERVQLSMSTPDHPVVSCAEACASRTGHDRTDEALAAYERQFASDPLSFPVP